MRPDIGRFFEGRLLDTVKLLKAIQDIATGLGADVSVRIDGPEMVFRRGEGTAGRGFLRVTPHETSATIAFPKGHSLLDPKRRAKGPAGSETRLLVRDQGDVDLYVRRMIDAAYALEK